MNNNGNTPQLIDASDGLSLGPATPEQIRASYAAAETGIIIIDPDGDPIHAIQEHYYTGRGEVCRRVYVDWK